MEYLCNCVNWPENQINLLTDIVENAEQISFRVFINHVGTAQVRRLAKETFGFGSVNAMQHDWAIRFYRSVVFGKTYYFIDWSAIEYVFSPDGDF